MSGAPDVTSGSRCGHPLGWRPGTVRQPGAAN